MKIEPPLSTAVFWRGGEKIDLNGLKPDAVWCLSVTGERKVNLSFLRDYPNLEELILMEKCEGVEVLSELKQLHTLSLWLSAPVSWDNVSLPGLRVLHLRGEKNGDITPLLSSITDLHLEEMRKTEDLTPFLTPATRLQKLYLQSLPSVQKLPALDGLPSLYALKLYELHKLSDLSTLSHSHLRYFAAREPFALVSCHPIFICGSDTGNDKRLVDIHPTADTVNDFKHNTSPRNSI